jgi:hypothetical protein
MAYNELMAHSAMQPPAVAEDEVSPFLPKLIGAFVATEGLTKGEQWLVFRNDGTITAAAYATVSVHLGFLWIQLYRTLRLPSSLTLRRETSLVHTSSIFRISSPTVYFGFCDVPTLRGESMSKQRSVTYLYQTEHYSPFVSFVT